MPEIIPALTIDQDTLDEIAAVLDEVERLRPTAVALAERAWRAIHRADNQVEHQKLYDDDAKYTRIPGYTRLFDVLSDMGNDFLAAVEAGPADPPEAWMAALVEEDLAGVEVSAVTT